jgi:hypothetical protein
MAEPHEATKKLIDDAKRMVRGPDGRIRIEDLLSSLAAVAGEMVFRRSRVMDLDLGTINPGVSAYVANSNLPPGSAVLSPQINQLLSGDRSAWADIPITSTFGSLHNVLTRSREIAWPAESFPDVARLYQSFAQARQKGVSQEAWGWVPLSIPAQNQPKLQPMRATYNLRQSLLSDSMSKPDHLEFASSTSTLAVMMALIEVRKHIDPRVAITLVFETINGMAKTVPMLPRHMTEVAREKRLPQPQPDRWM